MKQKLLALTLAGTMILGYGTGTLAKTTNKTHSTPYRTTYRVTRSTVHNTNHKYNHGKLKVIKVYRNGDILYTQHNCKAKNGKFKKLSMCGR